MTPSSAITELRKMPAGDLEREVVLKRMSIAKMRIGVEMRQEKDTAKLRREKRGLARMLTVLREKRVTKGTEVTEVTKVKKRTSGTSATSATSATSSKP